MARTTTRVSDPPALGPKWQGLHPVLVRRVLLVHRALLELGFPMVLTDGVRTTEQQQALYAVGRTKPGQIVTQADGVRVKSNHQIKEDGFGWAADNCFLVQGHPSWNDDLPWEAYGACAEAVGLRWGGRWTTMRDRPHLELKDVR
jgi:peptidoglycan L-alanyl-D-glutamate endopeptidase CwlK